jgi:hypothetical protein
MDSVHKENRYTFCAGDPVNLFDGTGHSETAAMISGIVVGTIATVIAGVLNVSRRVYQQRPCLERRAILPEMPPRLELDMKSLLVSEQPKT